MGIKNTQGILSIHSIINTDNSTTHGNALTRESYSDERPITPVGTYPTPESISLSVERTTESVSSVNSSITTSTNDKIESVTKNKNVGKKLVNRNTNSTTTKKPKKKKKSMANELELLLEDASRYDPNFEYSLPTSYKRSKPRKHYFVGGGKNYDNYTISSNTDDINKMNKTDESKVKMSIKYNKIGNKEEDEEATSLKSTVHKKKKRRLIRASELKEKQQKADLIEEDSNKNNNTVISKPNSDPLKINNFMNDLNLQSLKLTNLKIAPKKKTVVTIKYTHLNRRDDKQNNTSQSNNILINEPGEKSIEIESENKTIPNSNNSGDNIISDNTSGNNISTFLDWNGPMLDISDNFFDIGTLESQNFSMAQTSDSIIVTNHIESYKKKYHPPNVSKSVAKNNVNTVKNHNKNNYVFNKQSDKQISSNRKRVPSEDIIIKLQSPLFFNKAEKFIVNFSKDVSRYNPMVEIGKFVEYVALVYLPDPYSQILKDDIIPKLNEAYDTSNDEWFVEMVREYNNFIQKVPRHEIINHLKLLKKIPLSFIHDILQTVYIRTIHPRANQLKHYEAFSNYVYGELLPNFLSKIYKQCNMNESSVFLDLGSGVGNCVIQAALEYQCKFSAGCEIMKEASELTEYQYNELQERCKIMGLNLSPVKFFLKQSFVANKAVEDVIKECDILLVNNFLFDMKLNKEVEKLIQNVKVGCKIISLKSLRGPGYALDFYNTDNILSRLKVEKFNFGEDSVSWTHTGGEYYISTVLESIDESLLDIRSRFRRSKKPIKYTR